MTDQNESSDRIWAPWKYIGKLALTYPLLTFVIILVTWAASCEENELISVIRLFLLGGCAHCSGVVYLYLYNPDSEFTSSLIGNFMMVNSNSSLILGRCHRKAHD
jgi:hypothetical protein